MLYDMEIARETAARANGAKKGVLDYEGDDRVTMRSGVLRREPGRPSVIANRRPDAHTRSTNSARPVPSKLIDGLFGATTSRRKAATDYAVGTGSSPFIATKGETRIPSPRGVDDQMQAGVPSSIPTPIKTRATHSSATRSARSLLSNPLEVEKNRKRLVGSLKCNGSYPRKYRVLVWRFLLRLPKNEDAFRALVRKGKHASFSRLRDEYPLKDDRLFRRLHRVLSALAFWCPAFGEISYLPAIVYPFVKIFRENDLAAFEASMSIMLHWCGDYLFNLPNPPAAILSALRQEVERRDPQLYDHFVRHRVTAETYGWSLLKTIFTEVLNEDEWMRLWDQLITYSETPQLLVVAVLAYLSYFRVALLAAPDRFSIEQFFHQQNALDIQKFIQLLLNINQRLDPTTFKPEDSMKAFEAMRANATGVEDSSAQEGGIKAEEAPLWPLPIGQYPAFGRYPNLVVDFQISVSLARSGDGVVSRSSRRSDVDLSVPYPTGAQPNRAGGSGAESQAKTAGASARRVGAFAARACEMDGGEATCLGG